MKKFIPKKYLVRGQEKVEFQMGHTFSINIDITIEDFQTGKTIYVLDTKYKSPEKPSTSDIEQFCSAGAKLW